MIQEKKEITEKKDRLVEALKTAGYTDGTDVNIETALFEYGLLRNPKTNRVIFCLDLLVMAGEDHPPVFDFSEISLEDVKTALEDAPAGFYSFVGITKEEYLKTINNDYLSGAISELNSYNGQFNDYLTYDEDIDQAIARIVKETKND